MTTLLNAPAAVAVPPGAPRETRPPRPRAVPVPRHRQGPWAPIAAGVALGLLLGSLLASRVLPLRQEILSGESGPVPSPTRTVP